MKSILILFLSAFTFSAFANLNPGVLGGSEHPLSEKVQLDPGYYLINFERFETCTPAEMNLIKEVRTQAGQVVFSLGQAVQDDLIVTAVCRPGLTTATAVLDLRAAEQKTEVFLKTTIFPNVKRDIRPFKLSVVSITKTEKAYPERLCALFFRAVEMQNEVTGEQALAADSCEVSDLEALGFKEVY